MAHLTRSAQAKTPASVRRFPAPLTRNRQNSWGLFCAKPPRPVARLISAVGSSERTVGRGTGVHIAAGLRFGRSDRSRRLRGSSCRCGSGRPCRHGKCRWNNRCANRRTRCCTWRRTWHRRRRLRDGSWQRGSRPGGQACRRINHGRHRSRKPVQPQQHAAKSNRQHDAVDRKPHHFALCVMIPRAPLTDLFDSPLFRAWISRPLPSKERQSSNFL